MNIKDVLAISASGMNAQRARTEAIASNLANANVTRTAEGGPYKRRIPVFEGHSLDPFGDALGSAMSTVEVSDVEQVEQFRKEYDPQHPDADEDGYVLRPDIDIMTEMVDLMEAVRGYEANANVVDVTKEMVSAALRIGKG